MASSCVVLALGLCCLAHGSASGPDGTVGGPSSLLPAGRPFSSETRSLWDAPDIRRAESGDREVWRVSLELPWASTDTVLRRRAAAYANLTGSLSAKIHDLDGGKPRPIGVGQASTFRSRSRAEVPSLLPLPLMGGFPGMASSRPVYTTSFRDNGTAASGEQYTPLGPEEWQTVEDFDIASPERANDRLVIMLAVSVLAVVVLFNRLASLSKERDELRDELRRAGSSTGFIPGSSWKRRSVITDRFARDEEPEVAASGGPKPRIHTGKRTVLSSSKNRVP